jgi:pimeloyl-ACP methyl ester carboxylesterase
MDIAVLEMAVDRRAVQGYDAEGQLRKATPRALVLQANPDMGGAMTDDEAAKMAHLLPEGRLVKWDDSGHGMHSQFRQRFVDAVKGFLGQQK